MALERRVLAAVADAHARTGAPVMVHLEHGSAAFEVLEVLASDGVRPEAVLLAQATGGRVVADPILPLSKGERERESPWSPKR